MNGLEIGFSFGIAMVLKATLLLGLGIVLSAVLRRRAASLRHLLWTATFAALVVLPFPTYVSLDEHALRIALPVLPASETTPSFTPSPKSSEPSPRGIAAPSTASVPRTGLRGSILWIAGSALFLVRLGLGLAAAARAARAGRDLKEESWQELLASARRRLAITRTVRLRIGDVSSLPMTLGLFRSTILLPEEALSYSEERKLGVLLHELAHVRRRDCLTLALGQLASALYWWHPLVWIAVREMRLLGERASDDLVLHAGARPADYAHDLLEMARGLERSGFAPRASVSMAHRSRFEERLLAILDPNLSRRAVSSRAIAVLAPVALGLLVFVALAVPTRASRQVETPEQPVAPEAPREPEPESEPEVAQQPVPEAQPAKPGTARERARAALAEALDDPEDNVRETALHALVQMEEESAAPHLRRALQDPDPEIRAQAAWGLGQLEHKDAWEDLANALSDESPMVRAQAAWALGMLS
ncbi:MAG: M56 family metallopeptidase, partial [Vicinamibacteria bacterium]